MVRSSLVALLLLAACPVASAQERLALRWDAPPGCPDQAALRAEVTRLLGGAIPEGDPVSAEGSAREVEGGYRLVLRTRMNDAPGERTLDADHCEELGDAAALILALLIDPEAVAEATPAPIEAPPAERPPPEPPPRVLEVRAELTEPSATAPEARPRRPPEEPEPDAPAEPRAPEPETEGRVGVGGGLDVGTVPGPSAWLWLEAGWGSPLVEGRLRAGVVLPQTALRTPTATAGAEITSVSLDAQACVHPFEDARGIGGCGGLILGVSVAEGFGLDGVETGIGTYFGAIVSLRLAWRPVQWISLGLDAALVIPFNPLEFAVRAPGGDEVFHTQEPVSGRFGLAASVHF